MRRQKRCKSRQAPKLAAYKQRELDPEIRDALRDTFTFAARLRCVDSTPGELILSQAHGFDNSQSVIGLAWVPPVSR
jgi:hypothetical protein